MEKNLITCSYGRKIHIDPFFQDRFIKLSNLRLYCGFPEKIKKIQINLFTENKIIPFKIKSNQICFMRDFTYKIQIPDIIIDTKKTTLATFINSSGLNSKELLKKYLIGVNIDLIHIIFLYYKPQESKIRLYCDMKILALP